MLVLLNRKRTAYDRTNRIIATLKTYVLQSLDHATAHAHLLAVLLPAHPPYVGHGHISLFILLTGCRHTVSLYLGPPVYLCSFLSILNTRNHLRSTMDAQDAVAFSNLDASSSGSPTSKPSDFVLSANGESTTGGVLREMRSYHTEDKQPASAFEGHTDP
ncbi:uncharacterized protein SCHCODRAFT_02668705 [Schizophyllum commune H4-8]|nr:uncharacterized protein SCHCODRAFT_02668705 [Schizophyllum commune H4-8]KAI5891345.1 hypothetical protein SCHCODRAFT_02668705 [Schizophyllum commune H4-8]